MLTVEDYGRIRRAHRAGMSVREIARTFHHSRRKIREALSEPEPRPYTRRVEPQAPKLGPFMGRIEAMLAADETAPAKQRHTAMQVFRRLVSEHGYEGGYDQVRRYVRKSRKRTRETFVPLSHEPGVRVEVDFGHIEVQFPEERRLVPVLLMTWGYSNYGFALAVPTERVEALLHGIVEGLEFFGCVPREVWFDNPKTAVREIGRGRDRVLNPRYAALASHYVFEPLFCMPGRGNEKPRVEGRVYGLQRRFGTPVPRVRDLAELNSKLRAWCESERDRVASGHQESIGARFARDQAAARELPRARFDACVMRTAQVDKYQTVAFERNHYSVPRTVAFEAVTVKAYVDRIEVVSGDTVVARHERSYGRDEHILEPRHYLSVLSRRPGALDHSPAFRDWPKARVFRDVRQALESRHGRGPGGRQYVRVLELLGEYPEPLVREAVAGCLLGGVVDAERVRHRVEALALRVNSGAVPESAAEPCGTRPEVVVPAPNLSRYDALLSLRGGAEDVGG